MAKTPYMAAKQVLAAYATAQRKAGRSFTFDANRAVYRGGEDPGGWSNSGALACVIVEGTSLPNEYNHRDWLGAWSDLSDKVSAMLGRNVFFEHVNSCVVNLYEG